MSGCCCTGCVLRCAGLKYLFGQSLVLQQLLPALPGLVQSVVDGDLSVLHPVHDAQLHLIAQLKVQHHSRDR